MCEELKRRLCESAVTAEKVAEISRLKSGTEWVELGVALSLAFSEDKYMQEKIEAFERSKSYEEDLKVDNSLMDIERLLAKARGEL